MLESTLKALRRSLGDERGLALPMALGVMMILSLLVAAIFTYTTMNQGSAKRAQADQRAYGIAETGVSYAFATLRKAPDPYNAGSVPSTTVNVTGGTVTYSGSLSGNTWTLTGTGTVNNPSGPYAGNITRTASIQALVATTTVGDTTPWNSFFIDQPSGCLTLTNSVTIQEALYVRGDLCIQNTVLISSQAVHVQGSVYVSNNASIGTSSAPIPDFQRSGNCYYGGALTTCGPASRIWAGTIGTTPATMTKPPIDLPYWYANADLGPMSNCTTGSFPGGFDTDTTRNVSRGNVDLTPSSAYSCKKVVSGQTVAEISWVPGSNPSQFGILTVKGTIYIDGNLDWSNLNKVDYDGRATIYVSGTVTVGNQAQLCAVQACDATWDQNVDLLAFVVGSMTAAGPLATVSASFGNNSDFQGAWYMVNDFSMDNSTNFWGPVIARHANVTNSATFNQVPGGIGNLLPGMPSSTTTQTTVNLVQGSYSG